MDIDSLIAEVRAKLGELIQKPKMTEKLLQKPPFRFLHDTITAVTNTTGFGEGLYAGEELDSAAITDRQAKVNYLEKIFNLVGICQGSPLDIRAAKVVAGLEPECTNSFLLALATIASDGDIDNNEGVKRCLDGVQPGSEAPPKKERSSRTEAKAESKPREREREREPEAARGEAKGESKDNNNVSSNNDTKSEPPQADRAERGQSRGGTRGGKPSQSTEDTGLGGFNSASSVPHLDSEIERCDGSAEVTQSMLGELITRPKLSDKLLLKPPFRFLFDIVLEVIKVTGFASTLYQPDETDPANVTEKAQKLSFLEKIIKLVGVQLNTMVEAKPLRIIGGYDPQQTNNFLQLLAVAAKNMPDSIQAVKTVLDQDGDSAGPYQAPAREREEKPKRSEPAEPKEERVTVGGGGKITDERREFVGGEAPTEDGEGDGDGDVKRSSRPTTARRRPPKVKEGAKEVSGRDIAPVGKKTQGIMADGAGDDEEDEEKPLEKRLADEVKGEKVS
jgi:TRAF3-interacting protein 1